MSSATYVKPTFLWIGQQFEPHQLGGKQPTSQRWQVFTGKQHANFQTSLAAFSTILKHYTTTVLKAFRIAFKTTGTVKQTLQIMHWPGIEPGSTAWEAAMLAIIPPMP